MKHRSRFEWLKEYRGLHDEIIYKQWQLRKAIAESERLSTGDLANVRHDSKSRASKIPAEIAKYKKELHECEEERDQLMIIVNAFTGIDHQILRMKYIEGKTLDEIADELHRSPDLIRKKHAALHRQLDFLDHFDDVQLMINSRKDGKTLVDYWADDPNFYK